MVLKDFYVIGFKNLWTDEGVVGYGEQFIHEWAPHRIFDQKTGICFIEKLRSLHTSRVEIGLFKVGESGYDLVKAVTGKLDEEPGFGTQDYDEFVAMLDAKRKG